MYLLLKQICRLFETSRSSKDELNRPNQVRRWNSVSFTNYTLLD
jgi:hypothetical protein